MIPVLIDCDTGIDDALALLYLAALHHEGEVELIGATTTAGNVDVTQTAINTRWVLNQCGLEQIPVVPGQPVPLEVPLTTTPETHGEFGLGYVNPGPQKVGPENWQNLWRNALSQHADLRLIVTGPATNLATFGPVERTTLMGGTYLYPGNTTPTAEWNTWVDPHAAKKAFAQAESPITVCSLGVTERFTLNPETLKGLVADLAEAPIARYLPEMLRFYFEFHESQDEGYLAQIHDLITVMIALERVPFTTREVTVDVEADSELMRGTTVADIRGHWDRKANALLVEDVDVDVAHSELLRAAKALAARA